jgi:hemoglobin/transferrin/lactoferrin receptor protein
MKNITLALLGVVGATAPPVLLAEDLEQVTVTATRVSTPIDDAPATVSVISSETIEAQLAQDIKDLVRFEPGVAVRTSPPRFTAAGASTGRDGRSGFNIRGLEGNRVLILVDGIRMPDAYSFGAQSVGRGDYLDLDVVKSVEIVRGPASALYGSDGLAGSVSFITRDPEDLLRDGRSWSLGGRVAYASSDETFSESLTAAGSTGRWQALLAYTRRDGQGQETGGDNAAANLDRTIANPEDNASNSILTKFVFAPNETHRLRLTLDHFDRDVSWNVLSAIAKPPLTSTSTLGLTAFDELERDRVTVDYLVEPSGGAFSSIRTAVYYQDSSIRQVSNEDRNTAADRTRDSTFENAVQGAMVEVTSAWNLASLSHRFVYGADYSTTRERSLRNGTVPPVGESFPTRAFPLTDYALAGVFLQDEITLLDGHLTLFPALRWDSFEIEPRRDPLFTAAVPATQNDSHLSPKLGVVARVGSHVSLFANAAGGFKAPAPYQVNNGFANPVSNYTSVSNPQLQPETSETFELGVRVQASRWSGSIAAFTGSYDGFIEQVQLRGSFTPSDPGVFQFINLADVRIRGAEARGRVELIPGLTLTAAASYARGDSNSDGIETPLPSIEPLKLVAGLDWKPAGGRFGAQLFTTFSDGKDASRAGVSCTPSCFLAESFAIVDVVGWWKLSDQWTARAGVFNLTDEKYWWWSDIRGLPSTSTVTDAYSQPGRNVSASISMRF